MLIDPVQCNIDASLYSANDQAVGQKLNNSKNYLLRNALLSLLLLL